jgi:hypothetical protein
VQQYTAWQNDTEAYFNGKYRARSLRLDSVNRESDAEDLVAQWLRENKYQKQAARYTVHEGSVFSQYGVPVPIDELKATGRLVRISDWRSVEGGRSTTDLRDSWTIEQIVGVTINYDDGSAEIIPGSPKSTFELMMAEQTRMQAQ